MRIFFRVAVSVVINMHRNPVRLRHAGHTPEPHLHQHIEVRIEHHSFVGVRAVKGEAHACDRKVRHDDGVNRKPQPRIGREPCADQTFAAYELRNGPSRCEIGGDKKENVSDGNHGTFLA